MNQDPYKVLGISPDASDEEIKKAYSTLAKKYHPDLNPGNIAAEQKMKEINAAYNTIMKGGYESEEARAGYGEGAGSGQYRGGFGDFGDFGGFGGFGNFGGFGGYYAHSDPNEPNAYRAARNYINARHYNEALNVLSNVQERSAKWYYMSAMANAGLGNRIVAVQQAEEAARLEPDNPEYENFLNQLQYAGTFYRREAEPYPQFRVSPSLIFMALCLLQSFCFGCRGF